MRCERPPLSFGLGCGLSIDGLESSVFHRPSSFRTSKDIQRKSKDQARDDDAEFVSFRGAHRACRVRSGFACTISSGGG